MDTPKRMSLQELSKATSRIIKELNDTFDQMRQTDNDDEKELLNSHIKHQQARIEALRSKERA